MNIEKIQKVVKNINKTAKNFFITVDVDYSAKKILLMLNKENYQQVLCETSKEDVVMQKLQAI